VSDSHRHLGLAYHGARNVVRRWRRSLAIVVPLGLALAIATTATLIADGIRRDAARAADFAPDLAFQKIQQGRVVPFEGAAVADLLRTLPGVTSVSERAFAVVPAPGEEGGGALATVLGVDFGADAPPAVVSHGRLPEPGEVGAVALGRGLVTERIVGVGSTWSVPTPRGRHSLRVVGLLSDRVAVHAANLALTSVEDARAIAGLAAGEAMEISATLAADADSRAIAEEVVARHPRLRVIGRTAVARILDVVYGTRSGAFVAIWLVLLLVAPAVAWAMGMDVAASERHEMGVLKALGWSTLQLVEMRMFEAAILGGLATLGGALVGVVLALAGAPGLAELFVGWAELYPDFPLPLALEPGSALALVALGVVPLLAASAIPAWRVGSTSPEIVMRD
jgi:ABC-type lipoprotein release transport system permease subunit